MARRTTPAKPDKPEPALLAKPREEVRAQILSRIETGKELEDRQISAFESLEAAKADYRIWDDYNRELLRRAFTSSEYADSYQRSVIYGFFLHEPPLADQVADYREKVTTKKSQLVSLVERLDLIDEKFVVAKQPEELPYSVAAAPLRRSPNSNKKVFLVHGQDEEAKAVVARFITSCELEPVILHEQANGGRTIIEKFEGEADVGFAVVLMTADDVGGLRRGNEIASDELRLRARQNVVLELGYFAGRLGRERVAALKKGEIELPSDIAGVVWTPMDSGDAWKMSLVRELKAAGYEFDVVKALGL